MPRKKKTPPPENALIATSGSEANPPDALSPAESTNEIIVSFQETIPDPTSVPTENTDQPSPEVALPVVETESISPLPEFNSVPFWKRLTSLSPLLRWSLICLGIFGLGLLAGFLFFTLPSVKQYKVVVQDNLIWNEKFTTAQSDLAEMRKELGQLQQEKADLQKVLDRLTVQLILSQVHNQVTASRLALDKREGPQAQQALMDATARMNESMPVMRRFDAENTVRLKTLLEQAANQLASDPSAAAADLETLDGFISQMEEKLQS